LNKISAFGKDVAFRGATVRQTFRTFTNLITHYREIVPGEFKYHCEVLCYGGNNGSKIGDIRETIEVKEGMNEPQDRNGS